MIVLITFSYELLFKYSFEVVVIRIVLELEIPTILHEGEQLLGKTFA